MLASGLAKLASPRHQLIGNKQLVPLKGGDDLEEEPWGVSDTDFH